MSKAINNLKLGFPHEIILNYDVDKMNEVYYKADIFVSAEKRAGWANTVAEAMASGVPVIATKSGTKDLVINNFTGLIVKRNTRSIYNALKELIFNYEKRNTLPQNARKHVEQFDWNNLAKKIIDWYNNQK